jgi:N-acetylneuraminic acid mutarotase
VLVNGGLDISGRLFTKAELYDPDTGSWTFTANMVQARSGHTATLLSDGKVLVAGGYRSHPEAGEYLGSAELYDPGSGS